MFFFFVVFLSFFFFGGGGVRAHDIPRFAPRKQNGGGLTCGQNKALERAERHGCSPTWDEGHGPATGGMRGFVWRFRV